MVILCQLFYCTLEYCLFAFNLYFLWFEQQVSSDVAIVHPTVEPPPPYSPVSSWETNAATASANEQLRIRQEELERKAAELQRREDEIQRNMQYQGLLSCRGTTCHSILVSSCYVLRAIEVIKVSYSKSDLWASFKGLSVVPFNRPHMISY